MVDTLLYNSMDDSPEAVFPCVAKRLIFVGAGDFATEVFGWMASSGFLYNIDYLCFIDDSVTSLSIAGRNLLYLGNIHDFYPENGDKFVATIASPTARSSLVEKLLARGCLFLSYIDPSVKISLASVVGRGCIILPYSLISNDSVIGNFSIVNCHASVGHNVTIGSFVSISSHVDIMGHCVVGDKVFMGSGSSVLPGKSIGELATIGAGAIAVRSVPPARTLYAPLSRLL